MYNSLAANFVEYKILQATGVKSLPFLCLAVDWWRLGCFEIPFLAIFRDVSLGGAFFEVLCSHFWLEYVSPWQLSVVECRLCWKPGHVGFHQSNGPLTHNWMSFCFSIQTHFTEEIGLSGQKLYNNKSKPHISSSQPTLWLKIQCFTLLIPVYDNYIKISLYHLLQERLISTSSLQLCSGAADCEE